MVTVATVLMVCLGHRFLLARARLIGWATAALIVVAAAAGRVDRGAHWPADVLGES